MRRRYQTFRTLLAIGVLLVYPATVSAAPPDDFDDGWMVYGTTDNTLGDSFYDRSVPTWTGSSTPPTVTSNGIRFVRLERSPRADEAVLAIQHRPGSGADAFEAYRFTGTSWLAGETGRPSLPPSAYSADSTKPAFDVAYEQRSGDIVVVAGQPAAGSVSPLFWTKTTAGSWSAQQALESLSSAKPAKWVKLYPRPGSDEILLLLFDGGSNLWSALWDGSKWTLIGPSPVEGIPGSSTRNFAGAWEPRGRFLLGYADHSDDANQPPDNTAIHYRILDRTTTPPEANWGPERAIRYSSTANEGPAFITMVSDPASQRIAVAAWLDATSVNAVYVGMWDGDLRHAPCGNTGAGTPPGCWYGPTASFACGSVSNCVFDGALKTLDSSPRPSLRAGSAPVELGWAQGKSVVVFADQSADSPGLDYAVWPDPPAPTLWGSVVHVSGLPAAGEEISFVVRPFYDGNGVMVIYSNEGTSVASGTDQPLFEVEWDGTGWFTRAAPSVTVPVDRLPFDVQFNRFVSTTISMDGGPQTIPAAEASATRSAPVLTINDPGGVLRAGDVLKIKIPSGLTLDWVTSATSVAYTHNGAAVSEADGTSPVGSLSYPDADTAQLTVLKDLKVGDQVTVSGLGWTGYTTAKILDPATDVLTLEVWPSGAMQALFHPTNAKSQSIRIVESVRVGDYMDPAGRPQVPNAFDRISSIQGANLYRFKLTPFGGTLKLSRLTFGLSLPGVASTSAWNKLVKNLAPNSSFETDACTDYFVAYATPVTCNAAPFLWATDPAQAHSGIGSVKIANPTPPPGAYSRWLSKTDKIPVTPGKTYDVFMWLKTAGVTDHAALGVNFWSSDETSVTTVADSLPVTGTTGWALVSKTSVIAPAARPKLRVEARLWGSGASAGTLWADDVLVKETGVQSAELYVDANADGVPDGPALPLEVCASPSPSATSLALCAPGGSEPPIDAATNYILRSDLDNLVVGDGLKIVLSGIQATGQTSGQPAILDGNSSTAAEHVLTTYTVSLAPAKTTYAIGEPVTVSWTPIGSASGDVVVHYVVGASETPVCSASAATTSCPPFTLPAPATAPGTGRFRVVDINQPTNKGFSSGFTVTEVLELANHSAGQLNPAGIKADNALRQNPLTGVGVFRLRLIPYGLSAPGDAVTADLVFSLSLSPSLAMGDFTSWTLEGSDGSSWAGTPDGSANTVAFAGVGVSAGTDYVVKATITKTLTGDESATVSFDASGIRRAIGSITGLDVADPTVVTSGVRNSATSSLSSPVTHARPGFRVDAPASATVGEVEQPLSIAWSLLGSPDPNVTIEFFRHAADTVAAHVAASGSLTSPLSPAWIVPASSTVSSDAIICVRETDPAYAHLKGCSAPFAVREALIVSDHSAGQVASNLLVNQLSNVELFRFRLEPKGGAAENTSIGVRVPNLGTGGILASEITAVRLNGAAGTVDPAGAFRFGPLTVSTGTDYSVTADFAPNAINPGDALRLELGPPDISAAGQAPPSGSGLALVARGSVTPAIHTAPSQFIQAPAANQLLRVGESLTIEWVLKDASTVDIWLATSGPTGSPPTCSPPAGGVRVGAGLANDIGGGLNSSNTVVPDMIGTGLVLTVMDAAAACRFASVPVRVGAQFAFSAPVADSRWAVKDPARQITWTTAGSGVTARLEFVPELSPGVFGSPVILLGNAVSPVDWTALNLLIASGQDPQADRDIRGMLRLTDVTGGTHPVVSDGSGAFEAFYYGITWDVRDQERGVALDKLSVNEPATGWIDGPTGPMPNRLFSPITRHYPYLTGLQTSWFRDDYTSATVNWGLNDATGLIQWDAGGETGAIVVGLKSRFVVPLKWEPQASFDYEPAANQVNITTWLKPLETGLILDPLLLQGISVELFDKLGAALPTLTPAVTPDPQGLYRFSWDPGTLVDDATYFAKVKITYDGTTYTSAGVQNFTVRKKLEEIAQESSGGLTEGQAGQLTRIHDTIGAVPDLIVAGQLPVLQAVNDIRKATVGEASDLGIIKKELTGAGEPGTPTVRDMVTATNTEVTGIAPDGTPVAHSLKGQVIAIMEGEVAPDGFRGLRNLQGDLEGRDKIMLERLPAGQILNRETTVEQGGRMSIQFKTKPGLSSSPILQVFDPAGAMLPGLPLSMGERTPGSGLYELPVTFDPAAAEGEYTVIAQIPDQPELRGGAMDSLVVRVTAPLARQAQIPADFGTTFNQLKGDLDAFDTFLTNYGPIITGLEKLATATKDDADTLIQNLRALAADWTAKSPNALVDELETLKSRLGEPGEDTSLTDALSALKQRVGALPDGQTLVTRLKDIEEAIKDIDQTGSGSVDLTPITEQLETLQDLISGLDQGAADLSPVLSQLSDVQKLLASSSSSGPSPEDGTLLKELAELKKAVESAQGSSAAVGLSQAAYSAASESLKILQQLQTELKTSGVSPTVPVLLGQFGDELSKVSQTLTVIPGKVTGDELSERLKKLAEQAKGLATDKGYHFDSLYEMSATQATDVKTVRNQVEELKALVEIQRAILERNLDQPVMKTWFETR